MTLRHEVTGAMDRIQSPAARMAEIREKLAAIYARRGELAILMDPLEDIPGRLAYLDTIERDLTLEYNKLKEEQ